MQAKECEVKVFHTHIHICVTKNMQIFAHSVSERAKLPAKFKANKFSIAPLLFFVFVFAFLSSLRMWVSQLGSQLSEKNCCAAQKICVFACKFCVQRSLFNGTCSVDFICFIFISFRFVFKLTSFWPARCNSSLCAKLAAHKGWHN